jgi:hypothetical protein
MSERGSVENATCGQVTYSIVAVKAVSFIGKSVPW